MQFHLRKNPESKSARELRNFAEAAKGDKSFLDKIAAYESVNTNELSEKVGTWRPKDKAGKDDPKVFKTLTAPEIRFGPAVEAD